jgi:Mor family transcriptional regulator
VTLSKMEQLRLAARNKAIVDLWLEDGRMSYRKLGERFNLSKESIRCIIWRYCRTHTDDVRAKQRAENSKIIWRWEDFDARSS